MLSKCMVNARRVAEEYIFFQKRYKTLRDDTKQSHVIMQEFLLYCAIEALHVCMHLRCLGIGVIMRDGKFCKRLRKVLLELGTIVRKDNENEVWDTETDLMKDRFRNF